MQVNFLEFFFILSNNNITIKKNEKTGVEGKFWVFKKHV